MKRSAFISTLLLTIFAYCLSGNALANSSEIEAVRKPLESYMMGLKTNEAKYMQTAKHTEGKISYIRDGKLNKILFPDYFKRMKPRTYKDEDQRERYIESIEITGSVAVAKLIVKYPYIHYTDYMTLHKMNGEWKITNKIVYALRDPKNNKALRPDIEAAKIPLQQFIASLKTHNVELMKTVFYTEGNVMYMYGGKLSTIPFPKYIADFPKTPSQDEPKRSRRIESIQITGNIGIGKLVLEYPDVKFTDYMSLMRINGEWKITNKASNMEFPKFATR